MSAEKKSVSERQTKTSSNITGGGERHSYSAAFLTEETKMRKIKQLSCEAQKEEMGANTSFAFTLSVYSIVVFSLFPVQFRISIETPPTLYMRLNNQTGVVLTNKR